MIRDHDAEIQLGGNLMENSQGSQPVYLNVTLGKGTAIIPAWVLVLFAALFVISSAMSVVVLFVEARMVGEIRVLQIYEEDIENVLIRQNIASRSDFTPH